MGGTNTALILLDGEIDERTFRERQVHAGIIVCADGAAEWIRKQDEQTDVIIGDLDSITLETILHFRERGTEIVTEPDQNSNDFEKALEYLMKRGINQIDVVGLGGGRMDHAFANFSILVKYSPRIPLLRAYDEHAEHLVLTGTSVSATLDTPIGTTLSLTPYGSALGVTTTGLLFPLSKLDLKLGRNEGLSNVTTHEHPSIAMQSGALIISINRSFVSSPAS